MTGLSGRIVKRTVPEDKKPKQADIPTPDTSEKDAVLERLKERESQ